MRENLNKRNNLFTVIGQTPSPKSCEHNRRIFPDGMTWEHECNSCTCDNGKVRCTKVNFFLLFAHVRVFVFYRSPLFVCLCVWKRCTLDKDTGRTVPCDLDLAGLRKLFPPPSIEKLNSRSGYLISQVKVAAEGWVPSSTWCVLNTVGHVCPQPMRSVSAYAIFYLLDVLPCCKHFVIFSVIKVVKKLRNVIINCFALLSALCRSGADLAIVWRIRIWPSRPWSVPLTIHALFRPRRCAWHRPAYPGAYACLRSASSATPPRREQIPAAYPTRHIWQPPAQECS